jgi:asparagine synthase (glutamine-hydrolysing)
MCGIAGVLNLDGKPASPDVLKRMTDAIAHRGPDGEGAYADGNVGLGHRRLAIIDLSPGGHQPMATRDGRYVITYNGEIYNYRELRRELEGLGHAFASRSDTEVLLAAWTQWGLKALDRFNGMFAFALWDKRDKTLTLVRDRYGVKPLYYIPYPGRQGSAAGIFHLPELLHGPNPVQGREAAARRLLDADHERRSRAARA